MPSLSGVFSSSKSSSDSASLSGSMRNRMASGSMSAIADVQELESAMRGISFIMEDDLENAEQILEKGNSPYHKLGIGVIWFMKAVLGFEHDVMTGATEKLGIAESAANDWKRRSQKDTRSFRSDIYPPGSEYAVCNAEAQIMSAIVGVLTESLTEAVKGFYKLKKAISTLDSIEDAEVNFMKAKSVSSLDSSSDSDVEKSPSLYPQSNGADSGAAANGTVAEPEAYEDACEAHLTKVPTLRYLGYIESFGILHDLRDLHHEPESSTIQDPTVKSNATKTLIPAADFRSPIELFIAGAHALHHGMLLLMLSLVPPAFSKLMSIIGFKGDRERGLQLLWRGTTFDGVNGGTSAMILLGYYTNIISLLDIVPPSAYPSDQCLELVTRMRKKYPKCSMWRLHRSRILAADHNLDEAAFVMADGPQSPLQQIESIRCFELGLTCLYLHRYEECANAFVRCVELNTWSHALYYYVAGICHVELYRTYKYGDLSQTTNVNGTSSTEDPQEKAQFHADKAEELLGKVMSNTAKKRGWLSRQPPFDVFVSRKISKWSAIASDWDISIVDAVGVSPAEEMIYFWGGHKRMSEVELHDSLSRLRFTDGGAGEDTDIASSTPITPPLSKASQNYPSSPPQEPQTNGHLPNGVNGTAKPSKNEEKKSKKQEQEQPASKSKPKVPAHPIPKSWLNTPSATLATDDAATLAVIRAAVYRNFTGGKHVSAARSLLENEIINQYAWHDFRARGSISRASTNTENDDPQDEPETPTSPASGASAAKFCDAWPLPCARYELAVCAYEEAGRPEPRSRHAADDSDDGAQEVNMSKLKECAALLEEVSGWDSFDLDTRIGMKVAAGRETMRALL